MKKNEIKKVNNDKHELQLSANFLDSLSNFNFSGSIILGKTEEVI